MQFGKRYGIVALAFLGMATPALPQTGPEPLVHSPTLSADIRLDSYNVPHIKAETYEGLGYGLAYAFAGDNICLIAEQYLTLRGERAKYMGREGHFADVFAEALGERVYNVDSDFYHKLVFSDVTPHQKAGASVDLQKIVTGYVAGYNKFLIDRDGDLPSACAGAEWVQPITEEDVYRRFLQSQLLGGGGTFIKPIVDGMVKLDEEGNPLGKKADVQSEPNIKQAQRLGSAIKNIEVGSNAIAFGRDLTPEDEPMLFGNPHFPWAGTERLYQMHLTIPGEYDIMGASLYGIPVPSIAFNRDIAWSLTWSTDIRFLVRSLELNPQNPAQYYVDGALHDMDSSEITVAIREDDGSLSHETRTVYETEYGPLIAGQYFPGSKKKTYAFTDFNHPNNRSIEGYFQLTKARTVDEFDTSQDLLTGLPYSNVTALDASGQAYYSNKSIAANVSDEQIARCLNGRRAQMYKDNFAVVILDGSDSSCDPVTDPTAAQPGIMAATNKPSIIRSDYTLQTNDSHWIVNADPESFQSGYGYVVGEERTRRSDRLRVATQFIKDRQTNADGLGGTKMTPDHMKRIFYSARLREAELLKDDLVADCERHPRMRISWTFTYVDVSEACAALKAWDASENVDSRGGHIFRLFYDNMHTTNGSLNSKIWRVKFDPERPLETPYGMKASRKTRSTFAKTVRTISTLGVPFDARLGDIQFITRDGEKLPLGGGRGFHRLQATFVPGQGYTDPVTTGDSYIQAVVLGPDGPSGYVINAYSQSTDQSSPHSYDQTKLYSSEDWPVIRFTDAEIEADPNYRLIHIEK